MRGLKLVFFVQPGHYVGIWWEFEMRVITWLGSARNSLLLFRVIWGTVYGDGEEVALN